MKLLIVDNNDSFTWNLVQLAQEAGAPVTDVVRGDDLDYQLPGEYDKICFSPGPGLPEEFPAMQKILQQWPQKSILGVCLGLQAIGLHFGARLVNMDEVKHGRQVSVNITGSDYLFQTLGDRFEAGLYHSWVLSGEEFPQQLVITAMYGSRIMAIRHRSLDIHGVQFHPESIMTPHGITIMSNWLRGRQAT